MYKRDKVEPVRFVGQKHEISDAQFVYGKSSEQRYHELVEAFLIKLEERKHGKKPESVSEA